VQFIDLKAQYLSIEEKIKSRINDVLSHGSYILGPEVAELERQLAGYVGVNHCVTCANGTDALQLSLMALNIGPGDAVFTTPFTFFATAEVIALVGAVPVFVDIDPDTYNISPAALKKAINESRANSDLVPRAVIAVDLFGLPADYPSLQKIADAEGLSLIEDGAQGFGGEIAGQKACGFGVLATTSFFPAKPLGCYGDGGAVFTNDETLAEALKSLRVHGKGKNKYDNVRIGLNSRLDTLQAAILLEKLAIFPDEVIARNNVAKQYSEALGETFIVPHVPVSFLSSWAQYTLKPQAGERQQYMDALKAEGVPSAMYYPLSLHRQMALKDGSIVSSTRYSEEAESQVFSLPMHPYLSSDDISKVTDILLSV